MLRDRRQNYPPLSIRSRSYSPRRTNAMMSDYHQRLSMDEIHGLVQGELAPIQADMKELQASQTFFSQHANAMVQLINDSLIRTQQEQGTALGEIRTVHAQQQNKMLIWLTTLRIIETQRIR